MRGKSMVQDEYAVLFQKACLLGTAKVLENDPKIRYLSFEDHYIFIHLLKKKVSEKMIEKYKSTMVIWPDKWADIRPGILDIFSMLNTRKFK